MMPSTCLLARTGLQSPPAEAAPAGAQCEHATRTWDEGGEEAHNQGLQLAQQAAAALLHCQLVASRRRRPCCARRTRRRCSRCPAHCRSFPCCRCRPCSCTLLPSGAGCSCFAAALAALLLLLLLALALLLGRAAGLRRPCRRGRLHACQAVEEAAHRLGGGQVQQEAHPHQHEEAARRAVLVHHHHEHQQLQQRAHVEAHNDAGEGAWRLCPGGATGGSRLRRSGGGGGCIVTAQQLGELCWQLASLLVLAKHVGKYTRELACRHEGRRVRTKQCHRNSITNIGTLKCKKS